MSTLRELSQYLLSLDFIERDQFAAEQVGESTVVQSMTEIDAINKVFLLYREYYEGVIYLEGWTESKELILSHVATWIIEKGGRRDEELGFPSCESLQNDDDSFDILISIRFCEHVYIQADKSGDLMIDDTIYRRVILNPDIAQEFSLAVR